MRFFALMPVKNEAQRYLAAHLAWHSWMFDGICVFDDASIDASRAIADRGGADVHRRGSSVPSFTEHEGRFRQAAYDALVETYGPTEDDWIFSLDADEFVVSDGSEVQQMIRLARLANKNDHTAIPIRKPEVFDLGDKDDPDIPMIRTDGFWPSITEPRLFRYQKGGRYENRPMACLGVPTYAVQNMAPEQDLLYLLHYGYTYPQDRTDRYERYKTFKGHNPKHVDSIRGKPKLEAWTGKIPDVERG